MSELEKVKKLHNGKTPKSFILYMKYGEFQPEQEEEAAKSFFRILMTDKEDKAKAKKLGLI